MQIVVCGGYVKNTPKSSLHGAWFKHNLNCKDFKFIAKMGFSVYVLVKLSNSP